MVSRKGEKRGGRVVDFRTAPEGGGARRLAWRERIRPGRASRELTLTGMAASAILAAAAAWAYPGGTWAEPDRTGHAFLENFWCDLLRAEALNGRPNPVASELMLLALLIFAGTLVVYFHHLAAVLAPDPTSRWVRVCGWPAAVGVGLVALTPSDRFPALHAAAVIAAGPVLLAAVLVALLGLRRRGHGPPGGAWLAIGGLLLALVNLVQYVRQVQWGVEYAPWLPGVQKLSSLSFLSWMALVSGARGERSP